MSQTQVQLVGRVTTGAVFSGIVTANTSINVADNVGINSSGINVSGIITASSFSGDGSGLTGVGIGSEGSINTSGIVTASSFSGSGDSLLFSPSPTSFSPIDGGTGVSALSSPDISITYNQGIILGVGTITLRKDSSTGTVAESYEVGVSTRVSVSGQTLTIDPTNNFDYDTDYYVVTPQGAVTNYDSDTPGLALTSYNFSTEAGPTVTSFSPGIGSTNIDVDANIVLTFDKTIRAGVGTITLEVGTGGTSITESYDVSSSNRLTFSTNTLTIDPTSDLIVDTNYYVVIPDDAVAGYTGISTYEFDTIDLSLLSINPTNGATNVGVDTNITLSFTTPPSRGTGTVELRSGSVGGSLIESFDAASSGQITVSGNDWILNPSSNLNYSTTVYTIIPSTAIPNYPGLNIGGGTDSHSFTTKAVALGDSFEGGYLICQSGGTNWIVAPASTEVSRNWYVRNDAVTTANANAACGDWFVPSCGQLQNPGYTCRTYWDSYSSTCYWSDTQVSSGFSWLVSFNDGSATSGTDKAQTYCVRAFRCVTY